MNIFTEKEKKHKECFDTLMVEVIFYHGSFFRDP